MEFTSLLMEHTMDYFQFIYFWKNKNGRRKSLVSSEILLGYATPPPTNLSYWYCTFLWSSWKLYVGVFVLWRSKSDVYVADILELTNLNNERKNVQGKSNQRTTTHVCAFVFICTDCVTNRVPCILYLPFLSRSFSLSSFLFLSFLFSPLNVLYFISSWYKKARKTCRRGSSSITLVFVVPPPSSILWP